MKPRLIAVSGPLKGTVFPFAESELSVGRQATNRIFIDDDLVSRRHCVLSMQDGVVRISDLESRNGTFVNDVAVEIKQLEHGDRVRIGSSRFVFLQDEAGAGSVPGFIDGDDDQFTTTFTLRLDGDDAVYLKPEKLAERLPAPASRMSRDLGTLLRVSSSINAIRNTEKLQSRLLELILDVMPAQRAAILLVGHKPDGFLSGSYRERGSDLNLPFRISGTITRRVLREGVAVMSNDVMADGTINPTESLVAARVRSMLCVPLTVFQTKLGVIYADSVDTVGGFDGDYLQLLTAIASIAAVALEHVRYVEWLEGENQRLREETTGELGMIGESPLMKEVFRRIARVAPTDSTVLINGESGTGKELVAGAIHRLSRRSSGPFVVVNSAVSTETLLESTLFGHEKGAFTGAIGQEKGKFELADGGTLFLDELGDMSLAMQAMLLRVLEDGEIRRLGGAKTIKVNVRVLAATNRDLRAAISDGKFREDLFYRLNVFPIRLPPLRERRDDIPALANYFLQKFAREIDRQVVGFAPDVMRILTQDDWRGNVRELERTVESAVIMAVGERVMVEDLPESRTVQPVPVSKESPLNYAKAHEELSKDLIMEAFRKSKFSYTEAAHLLGLHPNYLHRLIRNLQIKDSLEAYRTQGR